MEGEDEDDGVRLLRATCRLVIKHLSGRADFNSNQLSAITPEVEVRFPGQIIKVKAVSSLAAVQREPAVLSGNLVQADASAAVRGENLKRDIVDTSSLGFHFQRKKGNVSIG